MGERSGIYSVSVGKAEGKRPLVRPMRRWEDTIKMGIQEIGWGRIGCYGSEWGGATSCCECGNEPSGSIK
jgi:hypothetical protein